MARSSAPVTLTFCVLAALAVLAHGCGDTPPPQITVTSPNSIGGWHIGGDDLEITWSSSSHPGNIDIHYTTDATGDPETWTWLDAALDVPNTGSYTWPVQGPPSYDCRIRVRTAGGGGVEDASDANFIIYGCMITSPVGGEAWPVNSVQDITWETNYSSTVDIELSLDGNWDSGDGSDVLTISASGANSGLYSWMIWEPESTTCLIRVSYAGIGTGETISPATFSIVPETPGPACYVRSSAPPGGDGLSWATAYDTIGDAIGEGREIWVAQGTYTEIVAIGAEARLYGGFGGSETSRDQRDWDLNETILDGENLRACMVGTNVDEFVLDGFTVKRGVEAFDLYGGVIRIQGDNIRVANCTFIDNSTDRGGALCATTSNRIHVQNCVFDSNHTASAAGAARLYLGRDVWFDNCVFSGNSSGSSGGAVRVFDVARLHFSDCTFDGNTATGWTSGSPEDSGGGGGVAISSDRLLLTDALFERCTFLNNNVTTAGCPGGGLDAYCALAMDSCIFVGNSASAGGGLSLIDHDDLDSFEMTKGRISNCVFTGNTAESGGGIFSGVGVIDLSIQNCTLSGNTAAVSGGGIEIEVAPSGVCLLSNLIVWGNTAGTVGDAIYDPDAAGVVTYSCIDQSGYAGANGNINVDPLFVDADGADNIIGTVDDDVSLQAGSLCIDSGDPATTLAEDIDGVSRPQASGYDMGAHEQ